MFILEALQKTELTKAVWETVRDRLGVIPFPDGEDAFFFKAVYFRFNPNFMDVAPGIDARVVVDPNSITLYMNVVCGPDTPTINFLKIIEEPISPEIPFSSALSRILDAVELESQNNGKNWCRIGGYKNLLIKSPYIDRLKAFCSLNPDVKIPLGANEQMKKVSDNSPEFIRVLDSLSPKDELPPEAVKEINTEIDAESGSFSLPMVKPTVVKYVRTKILTDKDIKRKLDRKVKKLYTVFSVQELSSSISKLEDKIARERDKDKAQRLKAELASLKDEYEEAVTALNRSKGVKSKSILFTGLR